MVCIKPWSSRTKGPNIRGHRLYLWDEEKRCPAKKPLRPKVPDEIVRSTLRLLEKRESQAV